MSVPAIHHDRRHFWRDPHQSAVASLLMAPAAFVWTMLLWPVGLVLGSALGLEDTGQMMLYEAGAWGVVAFVLMLVMLAVPPTVGIVLGAKARRMGERRQGTMGIAVNALVAAYFVLLPVLGAALFG